MQIFVNGREENRPPGTIAEVVAEKRLIPGALVIELNGQIIKEERWSQVQLAPGDRLELLSFVGGG